MKVKSLVTNSWFTKDKTYEVKMFEWIDNSSGTIESHGLTIIDDLGLETPYIPKFFIPLDEWRERQINKIL